MPLLNSYFARKKKLVERALLRYLPRPSTRPKVIHESMRYSIAAGGKRLRPILVLLGAEACGGRAEDVLPTACAMEFIHTYSLIHDDLPAMDDDDLRRGVPTNHKVYGEDIAILTGDALLTQAFELISANANSERISAKSVLKVIHIVARAAGSRGMVGGQVGDIKADQGRWRKSSTDFRSPASLLRFIHLNKTAALIRGSLLAGATLVGGSFKEIRALDSYGRDIGLAFQVADDILDVIGDKKKLGKRGTDRANKKLTFPALYGLKGSQSFARKIIHRAHQDLRPFGDRVPVLHELADFIIARDH